MVFLRRSSQGIDLPSEMRFFRPFRAESSVVATQGLRPGLQYFAASRLGRWRDSILVFESSPDVRVES
jgi:hypothetical protein